MNNNNNNKFNNDFNRSHMMIHNAGRITFHDDLGILLPWLFSHRAYTNATHGWAPELWRGRPDPNDMFGNQQTVTKCDMSSSSKRRTLACAWLRYMFHEAPHHPYAIRIEPTSLAEVWMILSALIILEATTSHTVVFRKPPCSIVALEIILALLLEYTTTVAPTLGILCQTWILIILKS